MKIKLWPVLTCFIGGLLSACWETVPLPTAAALKPVNTLVTLNWKVNPVARSPVIVDDFGYFFLHSEGGKTKDKTKSEPPFRDNFVPRISPEGQTFYVVVGPDNVSKDVVRGSNNFNDIVYQTGSYLLPFVFTAFENKLYSFSYEKKENTQLTNIVEVEYRNLFQFRNTLFSRPFFGYSYNKLHMVNKTSLFLIGNCHVFLYDLPSKSFTKIYEEGEIGDDVCLGGTLYDSAIAPNSVFYMLITTPQLPELKENEFDLRDELKGQVRTRLSNNQIIYTDRKTGKILTPISPENYLATEIYRIKNNKAELFVGSKSRGFKDGKGAEAQFFNATYFISAKDGTLYISDTGNHAIRKVDPEGNVTTLVGNGKPGSADGDLKTAQLDTPQQLALGPFHTLYIFDKNGVRSLKLPPNAAAERF